jgi:hypothetical protein
MSVLILFGPAANGANLGFFNSMSYQSLKGTTALLQVQHNLSRYVPLGGGFGAGGQLILMPDSIQVVDPIVIHVLLLWNRPRPPQPRDWAISLPMLFTRCGCM